MSSGLSPERSDAQNAFVLPLPPFDHSRTMATSSTTTPAPMTTTARFRGTRSVSHLLSRVDVMVADPPRLHLTAPGVAATRALATAIEAAKSGDPLRPVTVVMPSALA